MRKKVLIFIAIIAIVVSIAVALYHWRNNENIKLVVSNESATTQESEEQKSAEQHVANQKNTEQSESAQEQTEQSVPSQKDEDKTEPAQKESNNEVSAQETPIVEIKNESKNTDKHTAKPTGNTTYYIKVNYEANAVTIYEKDEDGYYTKPIKAMICSCGTATPKSGVYKTSPGYEWGYLEGGTFGRYSTRIKGGIMFHSVPYVNESEDSLEYWEYDKLGTTASLGCVRLCLKDCKWIFDNCETGTPVEFYADSDPGPLGKPTAQKISDNEECRNWDPTDTSPDSPWNN